MSRQASLGKYFKSSLTAKRAISVDIDGTIADISARIAKATSSAPLGSHQYWDIALSGDLYHMDLPISESIPLLTSYEGDIVYLSGRRSGTEEQTKAWLEKHGFPQGRIIHRPKGRDSRSYKVSHLRDLKDSYKQIDGHFGDRLDDDGGAARAAGVKFFHVRENDGSSWVEHSAFFK
jgi:uncharacterized HAD superfamily protein